MESSEMRENMSYWAEVRGLGQGGLCRASVARPLAKPEVATASTVLSKLTFHSSIGSVMPWPMGS